MSRPLPIIAGTVAYWPLNGTLADLSGNGYTLQSVDALTEAPKAPTYVSLDSTTVGVQTLYDGITFDSKLMVTAPLLRFTGAFTIQWTMVQLRTFECSYFCCSTPSLNRASAPDRIGSLYNAYSSGGDCEVSDGNIGSNLPSPFYGVVPGSNNSTWAQVPGSPPPFATPAQFTVTRDAGGNYSAYRQGVLIGTVASAGPHTSLGNERFYIGGVETGGGGGNSGGTQIANVRILNYARTADQVAADYVYGSSASSGREPLVKSGGALGAIGAAATGHMFRYAPKSFGDVYRNPGQT